MNKKIIITSILILFLVIKINTAQELTLIQDQSNLLTKKEFSDLNKELNAYYKEKDI